MTGVQIAEMTAQQWETIGPLVRQHMLGHERRAIDYGCGAGRFSGHLADGTWCTVVAYDPCVEFLAEAPEHPHVVYAADGRHDLLGRHRSFDLVFVAMVLGSPENDLDAAMAEIAGLLAPGGLLVLLDHMPEEPPVGRWWRFRPFLEYFQLCARHGIALRRAGEVDQGANPVTICLGRR
jgi:SAM-dependent methyltransferase